MKSKDKNKSPTRDPPLDPDMDDRLSSLKTLWEETDETSRIPLDDQLFMRFLYVKKTPERSIGPLIKFVKFLNEDLSAIVDYEFDDLAPTLQHAMPYDEPVRDINGSFVLFGRAKYFSPRKYGAELFIIGLYVILEVCQALESDQRNGIHFVINMKGIGFHNFHPESQKKIVKLVQDAWPLRLKQFTMLNVPTIFHAIFKIVSPWLAEKMKKKIRSLSKKDFVDGWLEEGTEIDESLGGDISYDELYSAAFLSKCEEKFNEIKEMYMNYE
eukprot:TRINITY_DN3278_c0_g1_i1.p1 TRINITY_DN3278_c0_g1~~TRINITY_DN3278_c0_g1_i1.p1  ORF type:complete len:300 (+),score=68.50 TRINITY_DN3278_c0_g1_i1:91-900(+)